MFCENLSAFRQCNLLNNKSIDSNRTNGQKVLSFSSLALSPPPSILSMSMNWLLQYINSSVDCSILSKWNKLILTLQVEYQFKCSRFGNASYCCLPWIQNNGERWEWRLINRIPDSLCENHQSKSIKNAVSKPHYINVE